jgi:hypothetical protein
VFLWKIVRARVYKAYKFVRAILYKIGQREPITD